MLIKKLRFFLLFIISLSLFHGCSIYNPNFDSDYSSNYFQFDNEFYTEGTSNDNNSYGDEMKIEKSSDVDLDINGGADLYERDFDHKESLYYKNLDFYNMKSKGSLIILHKFKTYQQTGENSSGEACILAILNRYNKKGDFTEEKLYNLTNSGKTKKVLALNK